MSPLSAAAAGFDVVRYEDTYHVVQRLDKGTIQADVERIQTNHLTGEFYEFTYDANMREIRMFKQTYLCASGKDANQCKKADDRLQTAAR